MYCKLFLLLTAEHAVNTSCHTKCTTKLLNHLNRILLEDLET